MKQYDVVIVGGGPAGSAAGSLLVQQGRRVLILEREAFPRFHIGESLIPFGNDVLREMGVWDGMEKAGFLVKHGAEFALSNACGLQRFWFRNNLDAIHARTFQVERSKFDDFLLKHAQEKGCDVQLPALAKEVEFFEDRVEIVISKDGVSEKVEASYVIDATGRDAWLGRKLSLPKSDLGLCKKISIFAHVEGAYRNEGDAGGHSTIVRMEEGWFWMIPLDEKKTSVGVVLPLDTMKHAGPDLESRFWAAIRSSDEMMFRLKNAKVVGDYHATSDFTYRYYQNAGPRWILAGDAAGFIDPIFSSGVMVALRSGRLAAQSILSQRKGAALCASTQSRYTREFKKMTGVFHKMIRLFYDNDSFAVFMNPRSLFQLRETINKLVAGQTEMPLEMRLRFALFRVLSWLQRYFTLAPRLVFESQSKK